MRACAGGPPASVQGASAANAPFHRDRERDRACGCGFRLPIWSAVADGPLRVLLRASLPRARLARRMDATDLGREHFKGTALDEIAHGATRQGLGGEFRRRKAGIDQNGHSHA